MSHPASVSSVAVIGAGIAGISCALALRQSFPQVTVFEKSPLPGGRMVSQTLDNYQFDCGTQYFTVRSDAFRAQVEQWCEQWLSDEWSAWLVDLQAGEALSREDDITRYIGRPQMHSAIEDMAEICDVHYNCEIKKLKRRKSAPYWELFGSDRKSKGLFDAVIIAVPAPEAVPLLKPASALAKTASGVNMTSCWSVMLAFANSLQLGFDGAYVLGDELSWAVRNNSKIERDAMNGAETWVLHAAPEWSDNNRKLAEGKVVSALCEFFQKATGRDLPQPDFSAARWWPYARTLNPLTAGCLFDPELGIGACGDWCYGSRLESAYLSGVTVAGRLLQHG